MKSGGLTDGGRRKREKKYKESTAGATVGVQKTEQTQLVQRRSAKACPLAGSMTEQPGSTCLRWLCVLARWFRWRQLENLDVARCVADRMIRARRVDRDQDVQMSRCCCNRGWQSRLRSTSSVALRGFDERRNWLNFTRASSYDGDESRCRRDGDKTRREPRITNGRGHGVHFTEIWTRDPW